MKKKPRENDTKLVKLIVKMSTLNFMKIFYAIVKHKLKLRFQLFGFLFNENLAFILLKQIEFQSSNLIPKILN